MGKGRLKARERGREWEGENEKERGWRGEERRNTLALEMNPFIKPNAVLPCARIERGLLLNDWKARCTNTNNMTLFTCLKTQSRTYIAKHACVCVCVHMYTYICVSVIV